MNNRGFTLIEVLVALAVLAIGMVILAQTLGGAANAYEWLDDQTQAFDVANDKLVEMQVYYQWPDTGTQDDTVTRNGRDWAVRTTVSDGPYPGTRKVQIEVGPKPEPGKDRHVYYTLSSLLGDPNSGQTQSSGTGGS